MQQYHHAAAKATDNTIYRVVGRNRNVPKSEAAMQTEADSALRRQIPGTGGQSPGSGAVDWKQAMAHNARVLSSQEKAMDEYLKRQRAAAEQHIAAAHSQLQVQQHQRHQVSNILALTWFLFFGQFCAGLHLILLRICVLSCSDDNH